MSFIPFIALKMLKLKCKPILREKHNNNRMQDALTMKLSLNNLNHLFLFECNINSKIAEK